MSTNNDARCFTLRLLVPIHTAAMCLSLAHRTLASLLDIKLRRLITAPNTGLADALGGCGGGDGNGGGTEVVVVEAVAVVVVVVVVAAVVVEIVVRVAVISVVVAVVATVQLAVDTGVYTDAHIKSCLHSRLTSCAPEPPV